MTINEIISRVDQQLAEEQARASRPADRRQQKLPVAEERRRGMDRRLAPRNAQVRSGDMDQVVSACASNS
jgi:hypothetical protein